MKLDLEDCRRDAGIAEEVDKQRSLEVAGGL
jgi:hypothetical protein